MVTAAERGHEVRQRLLAAAVELIPERGWTAVSTRILAERAGVTPSVVHYHFPSLAALLREAVVGLMGQMVAGFDSVLDGARTPAEAVEVLLGSVDQYSGADPLSLLFIEAYLAATRDELLREQIHGIIEDFRERVGRRFTEHGVPDATEAAAVFLASIDGLLLHRGLGARPDMRAVIRVVRRMVEVEGS